MKRYALLFSLLFAPMLAFGQNTYYADQYPGKTVGQKVTAAQKSCNAAMACIIRIEPILAGFPEGTMPAKCEKCTWLDQRTTGANWKLATLSADTIEFSPSSLSAAIASASAGGTVTATGRTSGTIATTVNINKSLHLVLDGVALTVSANPGLKVTASNVHVECKNNASITLTGANASFLAPEGTVANLTVEGCRIKGSGNDADYQAGISNASGQTLTNIKYLRNVISDVSLGIDINANLSGGINGFEISGNRIYNIVGTAPGHGYGIHHANGSGSPSSGVIANNTIERAGRHSIYQAKGSGVSITGNVIRDHRLNVGDSTGKAAIMVSRSSNVTVSANVVEHPTSGGICVDTDSGVESTNVVVQGNIVRNALDFYPVWIGTPAPATDGVTTDVTFSGNSVYQDVSVSPSFGSALVNIYSGKRINIEGNHFVVTNTAASNYIGIQFYGIGEGVGTANYTDYLNIRNNTIYGAGAGNIIGFYFASAAATSGIHANFSGNSPAVSSTFTFEVAQTNPNISISSDHPTTGLDLALAKLSDSHSDKGTFRQTVIAPTYQTTLSTPASSAATCTAGQMWADASYIYTCTATNTIKRTALLAF